MKLKKLSSVVAIIMMFTICVLPLSAAATSLSTERGSITLNITDSETEKPLANVSFRLYFVARAEKYGNNVKYELISPYDKANFDISDLQDASIPVHLAYFAESNSLPYTEKSTDDNGKLVFGNLDVGLYLIVPSQRDNHTTTPFLISIPEYDSQNGKWEYHIDASPKFIGGDSEGDGDDTYISVVKKWDTDKSHPGSVTVVLLRDFQEYEKVQLNESNNWHFRWDNLPKNHTWSVVETEVPKGYTVYYDTSSNTVTIINKSDKPEEPTSEPSADDEGTTVKPPVDEEDKLVQTGQLNWPVPVCAISGLLIFSVGWAVLNFGKKETE